MSSININIHITSSIILNLNSNSSITTNSITGSSNIQLTFTFSYIKLSSSWIKQVLSITIISYNNSSSAVRPNLNFKYSHTRSRINRLIIFHTINLNRNIIQNITRSSNSNNSHITNFNRINTNTYRSFMLCNIKYTRNSRISILIISKVRCNIIFTFTKTSIIIKYCFTRINSSSIISSININNYNTRSIRRYINNNISQLINLNITSTNVHWIIRHFNNS